jgi:HSP20 family protein
MSLIVRKQNDVWNPFEELLQFGFGATKNTFWPAIDAVETKDSIRIQAEIPGINKEDLKVSVKDNTLTISGEKKQETEKDENGYVRTERSYGSFQRSFTLPESVDGAQGKANYKNGVLELVFPKKEDTQPKQIDVQVN